MAAAVYRRRGALEVTSLAVPEPGPGDVVVRVSHCGICGTDLHAVLDGWGQPDSVGGHEWSGTVESIGDAVTGVAVGDRVIGAAEPGCGACDRCRDQRPSLCARRRSPGVDAFQGAFAERIRTPADAVMVIPDGLDLRAAAFAEPLAVALHAVTRAEVTAGDRVLVTGAGPIGAAAAAVMHADGVDVTVSEPAQTRRDLAARLGVAVVEPDALATPDMPADVIDEPYDAVIECSGRRPAIETGIGVLGRAGRLVLVGTGLDHPVVDINRVLLNEIVLTGAFNYDHDGFARALGLLHDGTVPVDVLVEPRSVTLDGMLDAMHGLAAGRIGGKVLVEPLPTVAAAQEPSQ